MHFFYWKQEKLEIPSTNELDNSKNGTILVTTNDTADLLKYKQCIKWTPIV